MAVRGRFRTARAQSGHSANYYTVYPGNTPENCVPASQDRCGVLEARGFVGGSGVAGLDGLLPCSSSGGEGLRWGDESALGMTKEMESILHCRFTTFIAS